MTNARKHNFEIGYKHGINGKAMNQSLADNYPGYADGWDAGWCDMPTLEELIPIDVAKERSTGCLS
jgi:hypothetical protein